MSIENNKEDKDHLWEPLALKLVMTFHDCFKIARAYLTKDEFLQWIKIYKDLAQKELSTMSEKERRMKELIYERECLEETTQQKMTKKKL